MFNKTLKHKIIIKFDSQISFASHVKEQDSLVSKVVQGWRELPVDRQETWAKALDCERSEIFPELNV